MFTRLGIVILGVLMMGSTVYGAMFGIGLHGGSVDISDAFESGYVAGGTLYLLNRDGFGFDLSGSYIEANGESGQDDIKMAPITLGATYYLKNGSRFVPYLGGFAGYRLTNSAYGSHVTYGGKAGLMVKLGPETKFMFEAVQSYGQDDTQNLDLEPLRLQAGLMISFVSKDKGEGRRRSQKDPDYINVDVAPSYETPSHRPSKPRRRRGARRHRSYHHR